MGLHEGTVLVSIKNRAEGGKSKIAVLCGSKVDRVRVSSLSNIIC